MSKAIRYNRPILVAKDKEIESKYAERGAWISTRALMKAKTWQDVIDHQCKKAVRKV